MQYAQSLRWCLILLAASGLAACADDGGPLGVEDASMVAPYAAPGAGPAGSIAFHSDRAGNREVYLMSPDGADAVRLTYHAASDFYPDISPNGNWVVFTSNRAGMNDIFMQATAGGEAINLTNTAGAAEDWARFSPNGQQVAFHGNATGNNEIYVLDLRTGELQQVTNYSGVDMWPEWSPNGRHLSFRRDMDVHVIELKTGAITRLTELLTLDQMAAWSPNGQQLAFMSFREGYCSVFVMNADGSDQRNLTPKDAGDANSAWCSRAPSWTRSGRILFMSKRPSTGGDFEVFSMNADGSDLARLTDSPGEDGGPTAR